MEIVDANCATLNNYEVLRHLQMNKERKIKRKGQLATITYETIRYLENMIIKDQKAEAIEGALKDLASFNLNKTEKLMLINLPPRTALEIQLMVEESEERFTEEQVEEILKVMVKWFPHISKENAEANEAEVSE